MSDDEQMTTDPDTGAQKAGNLERYDLIPISPWRKLAKHFGIGAKKYDDRNWERGYAWSKSYASLHRHLSAFWAGEDIDEETGSPHIIAAAWHCIALAEYMETHPEKDDRPVGLDPFARHNVSPILDMFGREVVPPAKSQDALCCGGGGNYGHEWNCKVLKDFRSAVLKELGL